MLGRRSQLPTDPHYAFPVLIDRNFMRAEANRVLTKET